MVSSIFGKCLGYTWYNVMDKHNKFVLRLNMRFNYITIQLTGISITINNITKLTESQLILVLDGIFTDNLCFTSFLDVKIICYP